MTRRPYLPAFCLSLALIAANAQTSDDPKPPAARETPPDQKAYQDATKLSDPAKKIEALEKFRKDFPDSAYAGVVDNSVLSTLLKSMPEQKDRIRKTAEGIYKAGVTKDKEASKGSVIVTTRNRESAAFLVASALVNSDVFLKDAETYARRSLDPMREGIWISEQRESLAKRKQPIPDQDQMVKRYRQARAPRLGLLGKIERKLGREAEARKLFEEAYAAAPTNTDVAGALGEMAAKTGDYTKALEYLIPVRLSGRAEEAANTALENIYKKQHNGSLDGLEAMLDKEYETRFPNPVHVAAYKPNDKRTGRVVLGEVFTGSGCPPCAAADLAFDAAMERYARKDFAVVMYHQHIPAPDPMTTLETTARAKYYAVRGVPTFAIDGKDSIGGGPRDFAKSVYDKVAKDIEKDLDESPEARIKVDASIEGGTVRANAAVDEIKSDAKDLKVQILLVEKELRFNGENGIRVHPMVVRAFGGEKGEGYTIAEGKGSFAASFDLDAVSKAIKDHLDDYEAKGHRGTSFHFKEKKYAINRGNLGVVVFVQDVKTRHILQAAWVNLATSNGGHTTTEANGNAIQ